MIVEVLQYDCERFEQAVAISIRIQGGIKSEVTP